MSIDEQIEKYRKENRALKVKVSALLNSVGTYKKKMEEDNSNLKKQILKLGKDLQPYRTSSAGVKSEADSVKKVKNEKEKKKKEDEEKKEKRRRRKEAKTRNERFERI